MVDHKHNTAALVAATLPELLPRGCGAQVLLQPQIVPKPEVLLVAAENIRRSLADDKVEAIRVPGGEWSPVPLGAVVHQLGTPLPPELCDMAVMIGTGVVDTLSTSLVVPGGPPPQPKTSGVIHAELLRVPLVHWREQHMRNLRGPEN